MAKETRSTRKEEAFAERRRLLDAQKTFANQMLLRYRGLESSILEDARKVVERIRVLRTQGLEPGYALEAERERITTLLDDVREQTQRWADAEMQRLSPEGLAAAKAGSLAAVKQVSMLGTFGRTNAAALERIVDRYRTLPVTRRYVNAGAEAKETVKQAMFEAVGKGDNPRTVVRKIREALGSTHDHADTIARTWIIDAHRGAGLDYYRSQGTRIGGWGWLCAKNLRTCPVCLAMDGTIHRLDEPFGSHLLCRCTHIPLLDDEMEEGPMPNGQQYYDALAHEDKLKVVGPLKAKLIADGKITLRDLVEERTDPDFGLFRREKSVRTLLADGTITRMDFTSAWVHRNEPEAPAPKPIAAPKSVARAFKDFSGIIQRLATQRKSDTDASEKLVTQQINKENADAEKAEGFFAKKISGSEVVQRINKANEQALAEWSKKLSAINPTRFTRPLTKDEIVAVGRYSGPEYTNMNLLLRGKLPKIAPEKALRIAERAKKVLDSIDASTVSEDIVVYRGMELKSKLPDDFRFDGIVSTSLDISQAKNFTGVDGTLFEIRLPKGTHGLRISKNLGARNEGEVEILLSPDQKYKTIEVGVNKDGRAYTILEAVNE